MCQCGLQGLKLFLDRHHIAASVFALREIGKVQLAAVLQRFSPLFDSRHHLRRLFPLPPYVQQHRHFP